MENPLRTRITVSELTTEQKLEIEYLKTIQIKLIGWLNWNPENGKVPDYLELNQDEIEMIVKWIEKDNFPNIERQVYFLRIGEVKGLKISYDKNGLPVINGQQLLIYDTKEDIARETTHDVRRHFMGIRVMPEHERRGNGYPTEVH